MAARYPKVLHPAPEPATFSAMRSLAEIEARIDEVGAGQAGVKTAVDELLSLSEDVLINWLLARGEMPSLEKKEGFRLLALQRQGARGDPSFNACRETCRELAYHYNVIILEPEHPDRERRVRLATMIAKHLCLFVSGKMQVASLGEFCCSAKPLRSGGA